MGEFPQLTRSLAQRMSNLPQVEEVVNYDGSIGAVDFTIEDAALSSGRLDKLLPDGYRTSIVLTNSGRSAAYIEEQ